MVADKPAHQWQKIIGLVGVCVTIIPNIAVALILRGQPVSPVICLASCSVSPSLRALPAIITVCAILESFFSESADFGNVWLYSFFPFVKCLDRINLYLM